MLYNKNMINFVTFKILFSLTDGKTHSAKSLAEENEVSTKTIIRGIENLISAGLFVSSTRGKNGGYYLEKSIVPDLSQLSNDEIDELIAICSLKKNILGNSQALSNIIEKFQTNTTQNCLSSIENKIVFDTIPWGKIKTDTAKIMPLKNAIKNNTYLKIRYGNFTERTIEPYCLTLKSGSWYLYAKEKDVFKLFKVSRIQEITQTKKRFITDNNINVSDKPWNNFDSTNKIIVTLEIDKDYLCEASEWLDILSSKPSSCESKTIIEAKCPGNLNFLYKLIEEEKHVKLLSPKSEVEKLISLLKRIQTKYIA